MPWLFRVLLPVLALLVGCPPVAERAGRLFLPPPPTHGLAPELIADAVGRARALPRLYSLVVAREGEILVAERFGGPPLTQPVNIKSASKSVLSAVVGIAIGRGVLSGVDQPIAPILSGDLPENPDPRLAEITVGDLLSMRSGLERTSGASYGAWVASANWVRDVLSRPMTGDPGGSMTYSTGNSHLLSAVLTRVSGRSTHALAEEWLARPLGVDLPPWPRDPQGIFFGGNDMRMSPLALVRFGELYRNDGMVGATRVLPEGWVAASWKPQGISGWSGYGYGYGWFSRRVRGFAVHFAWGYGGQMVFVVPDLALTVVMTSDAAPHPRGESHVADLHALLADDIIPAAVKGAPPEPDTQAQREGKAARASSTMPGVRSSGSIVGSG